MVKLIPMGLPLGLGCIEVAIFLMLGLGFALVFARIRRGKGLAEPSCGKCGYLVKGLTTFICPECGSDLREVGIVTPTSGEPSKILKITAWTMLIVPVALISTVLVAQVPPASYSVAYNCYYAAPASGAYSQITLTSMGIGAGRNPSYQFITFQLTPSPTTQKVPGFLRVEIPKLAYSYQTPDGKTVNGTTGLGVEVILEWLSTAGVDIQDQRVRTEASQLLQQVRAVSASQAGYVAVPTPAFQSTSSSMTSTSTPSAWQGILLVVGGVFWLLVWIIGLRRMLRGPKPSSSEPTR